MTNRKHISLNCTPEQLAYIQRHITPDERAAVLIAIADSRRNAEKAYRQAHPDALEAILAMSQEPAEIDE